MKIIHKKIIYSFLLFVCAVCLLEFSSRFSWSRKYGVPFFNTGKIINVFYPELDYIHEYKVQNDVFNILLLGGSVLNAVSVNGLETKLNMACDFPVKVFNLASPGHTSRDSYYKYKNANNVKYDLVIVYNSINEIRANYVPPSEFKSDYSHFYWYNILNKLDMSIGYRIISFPFTLQHSIITISEVIKNKQIPKKGGMYYNMPPFKYLKYGEKVSSAKSLSDNLFNIIKLSTQREEQLLIMTFASFYSESYFSSYSEERYNSIRDGFLNNKSCCPIEIWGDPSYIFKGLDEHNEVIKTLAEQEQVLFVDMAGKMSNNSKYFSDVCHFTVDGEEAFVSNMLPFVKKMVLQ